MNNIPLARACALLPFLEFLKNCGAPAERLLHSARLPSSTLEDPEALIPLHSIHTFVERVARLEGIENFGLIVGQQTQAHHLGAFGALVKDALTLYDALLTATRLVGGFDSGSSVWLERQGDRLWFNHQQLGGPDRATAHLSQYQLVLMVRLIRLVAGPDWLPEEIRWQMPRQAALARQEIFADSRLHFEQPSTALVLPLELASRLLPRGGNDKVQLPGDAATHFLATAPALDFAGSLEQLLRLQLKHQPPNLVRSAELAGLSPRTLQRRLREEQWEYSRLCEKIRFERAVALLREPNLRLTDIAHELGYSDSANFNRAFRRWAGVSPSEFRRQFCERK